MMDTLRAAGGQYRISVLVCLLGVSSFFFQHAGAAGVADTENDVPQTLQEYLDRKCNQHFAALCAGGNQSFCGANLHAVARRGVGTTSQNTPAYRCYDKTAVDGETVDTSENGVQCFDNCGSTIPCKGTVKRSLGSFHSTRESEIQQWVEEAKPLYCSALQQLFNDLCNERSPRSLGRIEKGTLDSPLQCVSLEPEPALNVNDDLQHYMDKQCKEAVKALCRNQSSMDICKEGAIVVYREGFGHENQQVQAGRCYDLLKITRPELVNTDKLGVRCVDNCGQHIPCGGTVDITSTQHVTHSGINGWLRAGVLKYCSPAQNALQKLCDVRFAGSIARFGVVNGPNETGQYDDRWRCLRGTAASYEGLGMCKNNCNDESPCHGGRRTTGALQDDLQLVLEETDVAAALAEVSDPCDSRQMCRATTENPPTCVAMPFEALQPSFEGSASTYVLDGETLSSQFTATLVTVSIGDCFNVKIDIEQQKLHVTSPGGKTIIPLGNTHPPYSLELHRTGDTVTLKLFYGGGEGDSGSLFYVLPSASCVDSDPVVITGLEEGATFTRGALRDIKPASL